MGEKLCLVAPDMQELMTDQLDEKSTKIVQFGDKLTFGLQLGNIVSNYGSGIALIEPNLPNGTIAAIDTNYVKLRPLREWRAEELAKQQIQDGLDQLVSIQLNTKLLILEQS